LLSAVGQSLCEWNGSHKVVIGLEGHGREDGIAVGMDTSRTVGWFTNLYPVLLSCGGGKRAGDLIKGVKEELRQVPGKGLGYGVLRYINRHTDLQGSTPWEVVFNYLGQVDNVIKSDGLLSVAGEWSGESASAHYEVKEKFTITMIVRGGSLMVDWRYSTRHYEEDTVRVLAEDCMARLGALITHCVEQAGRGGVHTPSDYGLTGEVSYAELDQFLKTSNNKGENLMEF
jgi:non-ribosomal peptide synthase protein (TIGR01720 family)